MATKKKAAKPAKKVTHKKAAPAKKPAAKPAKHIAAKHTAAKKPVAKASKPVAKKPAPKKAAAKHAPAKAAHSKPVPKKELTKKLLPKAAQEKKPEAAKHSIPMPVKQAPPKPVAPAKPVKVVVPEIKTKTVRKYEPEFTKSVLDTPQQEQNNGPTMRYNDTELAEFRELITKKLDAAKKELAYLQGLITRKDEMGGDNDDARYMTMEDGSMSMEREQLSQMASRQITFIDHLEKAMMRIENKTYGICRVTGKLIDKARLRAVPHATLSIEAKQTMNK
jgi:RNA polymerase-binding transcription factor DksA